jgi:hypothetical protein
VKVDDNLEVVFLRPSDSLEKVVVLPLYIWFARSDVVSPISNRDAHVIESRNNTTSRVTMLGILMRSITIRHPPSTRDCCKVILGNPCIPMLVQLCLRDIAILVLSERPLVNNESIACLFEQTWRDPRLGTGSGRNEGSEYRDDSRLITHL